MFDVIGINDNGRPWSYLSCGFRIESQPYMDTATAMAMPKERCA